MTNQTGWYKNDEGDEFHVLGKDMSDETINALGKLAVAARRMSEEDAKRQATWQPKLGDRVHIRRDKGIEFGNDDTAKAFEMASYVGVIGAIDDTAEDGLKFRVDTPYAYDYFARDEIEGVWL